MVKITKNIDNSGCRIQFLDVDGGLKFDLFALFELFDLRGEPRLPIRIQGVLISGGLVQGEVEFKKNGKILNYYEATSFVKNLREFKELPS